MTIWTHIFGALRKNLRFGCWEWRGRHGQWLDSSTGLLTKPALGELGEPMLQRCQRRSEPVGVLVFDFHDLAAVGDLYGPRVRGQMLRLIGRQMRHLAGGNGLALRLTSSRFLVLMPRCSRTVALDLFAARLGRSCSFELDGHDDELVLVPRIIALCATAETDSIKQLLLSAGVQPQPAHRQKASKARPSAPSPVPMPAAPAAAKAKFDLPDNPRIAAYQPYLATFPMPLSRASGR